ncbi:hypothetical protein FHQ18_09905 [Deferribacter autotrophicus]|uniref:Type II secretion system protein GspC N-terminal domain-containing protein n=1 Tax=Deferribacter autotrophicus TaxID=500465 RepID=A0A5A8F334_9BACT|nr:hypothetical protein [Deferribacter autotrophicus]KAA0257351.1 hypothetical protein FHQ18_09905 [Deferribacter autotrophicus]
MRVLVLLLLTNSLLFAWDMTDIPKNNFYFINKYNFIAPVAKKEIPSSINSITKNHQLKLTGIIKMDNIFYAIINGENYKIGDAIKGFKIISINMEKVVLEKNRKKVELYVGKN